MDYILVVANTSSSREAYTSNSNPQYKCSTCAFLLASKKDLLFIRFKGVIHREDLEITILIIKKYTVSMKRRLLENDFYRDGLFPRHLYKSIL